MLCADARHDVLSWYHSHQRKLPWRANKDAWSILLSEVILQQTQVSRGTLYWQKLLHAFPSVEAMADASVDEVLKIWEGAGYYSRARRLHGLSLKVMQPVEDGGYGGQLPTTYAGWLDLPGIGPYTAAAIASIAHGEPVACVDGNIRRVMARLTANPSPSPNEVMAWAQASLDHDNPGDWNQALMELGATVCMPKKAQCAVCPLQQTCHGRAQALSYPSAKPQKVQRVEWFTVVRFATDSHPVLVQRSNEGLFGGLWGPVYEEKKTELDPKAVYCGQVQHGLSHRDILVDVYTLEEKRTQRGVDPKSVAISSLDQKVLNVAQASRQAIGHD